MQYVCGHCHSPNVERYVTENRNMYRCLNCGHDDSRVIGAQGDFAIEQTADGKIQHRSSIIIVVQNRKTLMLDRRNRPFGLSFPGGHVDYKDNADYVAAAQRELREETGIIARREDFVSLVEFPLADQQCHASPDIELWHVFLYRLPDGPPQPVAVDEEHDSCRWIVIDQLSQENVAGPAREAMEKIWNKVEELA